VNKGVIALILPDDQMPRDPNGVPFDIIMNPQGVVSRKNIGQLIELFATRLAKYITDKYREEYKKGNKKQALSIVLEFYSHVLNPELAKSLTKYIKSLKKEDLEKLMHEWYEYGVPILNSPMYPLTLRKIYDLYKTYGLKPKDYIYDPSIGGKTKKPCAYGYIYWAKTKHLHKKNFHARSIGPYSVKSGQAVKGKKHEGGQRLGELDVNCLIAYDAPNLLKEFFTIGADDLNAKFRAIEQIYKNGKVSLRDIPNTMTKTVRDLWILLECMAVVRPKD